MLTNRILTHLPDAEFARLMPLLEPVSLSAGQPLAEIGETPEFVYFPENSIISSHAYMQDGRAIEIGMAGFEGIAGLTALLGARPAAHSLDVLVPGSALRVKKSDFEQKLASTEHLRRSLLAYSGEYLTQVSQRAACAMLHRMEQRLAVWLLLVADRIDTDTIEITQERIAQHLGVRRAGITEIAGDLQSRGIISYARGQMRFVNRQALEKVACECYAAMSDAQRKNTYI
ncbi:MAG TPA: Crp/Fnr family transcriptional regulator [Pyrinomonadaceae bacterium]|nr:Crp/Fnr family transcriptional regulator [Pyrinomonadaceae bacterium]